MWAIFEHAFAHSPFKYLISLSNISKYFEYKCFTSSFSNLLFIIMLIMLNKPGFLPSFDACLLKSVDKNFIVIARGNETLTGRVIVRFKHEFEYPHYFNRYEQLR